MLGLGRNTGVRYAMIKGERLRVVNETKDLWKLEGLKGSCTQNLGAATWALLHCAGEKTIPKCQVNTGGNPASSFAKQLLARSQLQTA